MIKKGIILFLCLLCIMPAALLFTSATDDPLTVIETLDNGDRIEVSVTDETYDPSGGDPYEEGTITPNFIDRLITMFKRIIRLLTGTKSSEQAKYVKYYDKSGTLLWSVTLYAEFSYSKAKVTCARARMTYSIYDNDWKFTSLGVNKSGNTASGRFIMKQTKLGVPLRSIERTITLSCDKNGRAT